MLTFAMGGISNWIPEFLHNPIGLSVAKASQLAGASTVIDGILGTAIGGWIAQRWLRTNHRALYLLSFWSVALTLPFGILLFFGPSRWAVPALFAAEFFLFLNTGPLNTAIVNSVSAPVRATAVSVNLFCIHFFGDTFSPQIIGTNRRPATLAHRPRRHAHLPRPLLHHPAHWLSFRAAVGRAATSCPTSYVILTT